MLQCRRALQPCTSLTMRHNPISSQSGQDQVVLSISFPKNVIYSTNATVYEIEAYKMIFASYASKNICSLFAMI